MTRLLEYLGIHFHEYSKNPENCLKVDYDLLEKSVYRKYTCKTCGKIKIKNMRKGLFHV